jgi:hypothetical protein
MTSLHSRRKLRPRDAHRFVHAKPALFAELAQVICATGALPQKELHECWQMANVVHKAFPEIPRVADLAAGHGLLAWILVLLARSMEKPVLRTALAVDIKRPPSAMALAEAITKRWPQLAATVHFVEGSIDAVRTEDGPGTLFVAAHACGSLSDRILMAAMRSCSPVAIMPCCHSLRKQASSLSTLALLSGLPEQAKAVLASATTQGSPVAAIDQFRMEALSALGYQCREDSIQADITKFHRILLGQPPSEGQVHAASIRPGTAGPQPVKRIGEIPAFERIHSLDIANIEEAQSLSMRPSREWIRSFDLSFWVKDESIGERLVTLLDFLMQGLAFTQGESPKIVDEKVESLFHSLASGTLVPAASGSGPMARSIAVRDRYSDPMGRLAFTYRIEVKSSTVAITKADVILLRRRLCLILLRLSQGPEAGFVWRGELEDAK